MLLSRAYSWANDSFLKPYVYKGQNLGEEKPRFAIDESGVLPAGVSFALQQRTRYESLNSQFRSRTMGSDQALSLRKAGNTIKKALVMARVYLRDIRG